MNYYSIFSDDFFAIHCLSYKNAPARKVSKLMLYLVYVLFLNFVLSSDLLWLYWTKKNILIVYWSITNLLKQHGGSLFLKYEAVYWDNSLTNWESKQIANNEVFFMSWNGILNILGHTIFSNKKLKVSTETWMKCSNYIYKNWGKIWSRHIVSWRYHVKNWAYNITD